MLDHDATAAFLDLSADALNADALVFTTPFQFHKRGVETRLVIGVADARAIDATLLRNIARAHRCYGMMRLGETLEAICASENVSRHRMLQIIDLAFLSPDIVRAMALGDQPLRLTTKWLEKTRCHPTGKRSGRSPRSCAHRDPCTPEASRFFLHFHLIPIIFISKSTHFFAESSHFCRIAATF